MRRKILLFIVLTLVSGIAMPSELRAGNENGFYNPEEDRRGSRLEIDDIGRLIIGFNNKAYEDISGELFDRISTHSLGVPINDFSTVIGDVRRKVFDNRNGTFTVLDLFGIRGVIAPGDTFLLAGMPFYSSVGSELGANAVNIRQYDNKASILEKPFVRVPEDAWYSEIWKDTKTRWFGVRYLFDAVNGTLNILSGLYRSQTDEFKPRYESLLDVITPAFRIPFSAHSFLYDRVPGEISSYTLEAGIFFSLGAGAVQRYLNQKGSANLGYNVYLKTGGRVTILKERTGNFAKITVSTMTQKGHNVAGKIKAEVDLIEGILFGEDLSVSITPFKISWGRSKADQIDVTYRFNMEDAKAREAYEKATRGNFIAAEELAAVSDVVQHVYDKDIQTDAITFFRNFNLLIWSHQNEKTLTNQLITIHDSEGVNHVFRSISKSELSSGNILHSGSEKFQYYIETVMELEDPEVSTKSINPVVQIVLFSSDRHAYGDEIRERFQMVEEIIRNPQFFEEGRYNPTADYGKMSLDFEIRFYLEAVDQILEASEDDMWKALAKAFNIKPSDWGTKEKRDAWVDWQTYLLYILRVKIAAERIRTMKEAKNILDYFMEIKEEKDKKERAKLLSTFHHESDFQWNVLTAMLELADEEDLYYRIQVKGKKVKDVAWEGGRAIEVKRPDVHEEDEKEMKGQPTLVQPSITDVFISQPSGDDRLKLVLKTDVDTETIDGFYFMVNKIWFKYLRPTELYRSPNDSTLLHRDFKIQENGEIWVYLDTLKMRADFKLDNRYEMQFAFLQKDKVFSKEVKLEFKYKYRSKMKVYWVELNGKKEAKHF